MPSSEPFWEFSITLAHGAPGLEKLTELYEILAGASGFFDAKRYDDDGWPLDRSTAPGTLAQAHLQRLRGGSRVGLDLYGPGPKRLAEVYASVAFGLRAGDLVGSVNGAVRAPAAEKVVDGVARLCAAIEAPVAHIGAPGAANFHNRNSAFRTCAKAAFGQAVFPWGPRSGLFGVAHRTVLGRPFIDLIGRSALQSLPEALHESRGPVSVLNGSAAASDWTAGRRSPQEKAIVEQLGEAFFFNPETGALPEKLPTLPPFPSFPVYALDANRELVSVPPGALPPAPPAPPRKSRTAREGEWMAPSAELTPRDFGVMASTAFEHVGRLVPNFWSDAAIYWMEEFIRGRADAGDVDKYAGNVGAWLGEFMRDYLDCEWERTEETPAGWRMRAVGGDRYDPFALIASIEGADAEPVLKPVLSRIKPGVNLQNPDGLGGKRQ